MKRFDRTACDVIDLSDYVETDTENRRRGHAPTPYDRLVRSLSPNPIATRAARAGSGIYRADHSHWVSGPLGPPIAPWRTRATPRGWQTARREADLERLVDELSAEVQRIDEDLDLLLSAATAG